MIKEINCFNNYFVDDLGNVYKKNKAGELKLLSQFIDTVGYKQVILHKNGKRYYKRVHRLVAEHFVENIDCLPQVMHKNDIKTDCRASNLEWGTNQQNTQDGYKRNCYTFKCRSYKIKCTNKDTGEVIIFKSIRECAKILNHNRKKITMILNNEAKNSYNHHFEYLNV